MAIVVDDGDVQIIRLELGPYGTNAYIVVCKMTMDSLVVDAPAEAGTILRQLNGTHPRYIVLTHNHMDHTGALAELKDQLSIPLAAHPLDSAGLPCRPDINLADGSSLNIGALKIGVIHTPGHTPGSVCLLVGRYLLAGDTIFPGGPGHTATPANFQQILRTIESKIIPLPDNIVIYPGHGDAASLEGEKKSFLAFTSRTHAADLCGDVTWSAE
jgi:hydroxyacylglutathione hydrolase